MTRPRRIQRRRTKGWRMPEGAVYVGRPSRWGNPFHAGQLANEPEDDPAGHRITAADAVAVYWLVVADRQRTDPEWLTPLRGHDLVCWCPLDHPCHADVLLELAN